jgi:acetyl-CoA decarbonylase/synthase complex subunit delta
MAFEMVKDSYSGKIREVTLGTGDNAVKVGGESCLPFCVFEGEFPNRPRIAMEVWDMEPPEWPDAAKEPFKDVLGDPAAWAKKCVQEYGAEMIALELRSTDPNDRDAGPDEAVKTVKSVLDAVDVPVVVWGTANHEKDSAVLKKVAEQCENANLAIGPIEDADHKAIGAAVMGFGQSAIGSSPIDINLAKQVNILLENLGVSLDKILIDPTTGGLGYGMEYSYSVMERIKLAALNFGDDKLQNPIINNLSYQVWGCKEAKQPLEENRLLGDPERRAILMETVAAVSYLFAGSDVLILRHPETVRMTRAFIQLMFEGGSAQDVAGISKMLSAPEIDYASMAPEPDLTIEEEKKAAPKKEKKAEPAKEEAKAEAPKEEAPKPEKPEKEAPKEEAKPEPAKEEAKAETSRADEEKIRAELEEKLRREMEAKVRAEMESKAKSEEDKEEAKKKAEEEKKRKQEEEARKKAEEEAKKREKERAEMEREQQEMLKKIRKKREEEAKKAEVDTVPEIPEDEPVRLLFQLDQIHRRTTAKKPAAPKSEKEAAAAASSGSGKKKSGGKKK